MIEVQSGMVDLKIKTVPMTDNEMLIFHFCLSAY